MNAWAPRPAVVLVCALAVALAGCYRPVIGDGTLRCAGKQCPRGFQCADNGLCYRMPDGGGAGRGDAASSDSSSSDATGSDAVGSDAAGSDANGDGGDGGDATRDGLGLPLGAPCGDPSECSSGFCADGVCCKSACGDACKACNLDGSPGVCAPVPAATLSPPPHAACAVTETSTCKTDGKCDGQGACRMWPSDTVCRAAQCNRQTNQVTREARCDGNGACMAAPQAITCAPYLCDAAGVGCYPSCTPATSAECAPGNSCVNSSCGTKPKGSSCTGDGECTSGMCVDGVCCTGRCAQKCEACDLDATLGDCAQVTAGPPHGTRGGCGGAGACVGSCSAAARSACTFPGSTVTCRERSCSASALAQEAGCDGSGACATAPPSPCGGGLACNAAGSDCLTACTRDADCVSSARPYCAVGACTAARPIGLGCAVDGDCQSTHCVDGRCCDGVCAEPCNACDVRGHEGRCTLVPTGQAPTPPRLPCAGSGACQGRCDGTSAQCHFPANETSCTCPALPLSAASCDGTGSCRTLGMLCL